MTTLEAIEILVRICWLIGAVGFVLGLARMNSPATARNGNLVSAGGMVLADRRHGGADPGPSGPDRRASAPIDWALIIVGVVIGGGLGLYTARTVKMTAMPQLVSLFNAVGGGAAALSRSTTTSALDAAASASTRISSSCSTSSSARSRSPGR